jgi:hypothetical protein
VGLEGAATEDKPEFLTIEHQAGIAVGMKATAACMFRISKGKETGYYVLADDKNSIVGFESIGHGLVKFEIQNRAAMARQDGLQAGAILRCLFLGPRVFEFGTLKNLKRICGKKPAAVTLSGTGFIPCTAIYCSDKRVAAAVYRGAKAPRLDPQ